ncbi:hypothetical protein M1N64_04605 [Peptococcaceae bacterium]|nr:hypothetical protein [Peptococcaceae bacterium]
MFDTETNRRVVWRDRMATKNGRDIGVAVILNENRNTIVTVMKMTKTKKENRIRSGRWIKATWSWQ